MGKIGLIITDYFCNMDLDVKLSFFAGWLFTMASTITLMGFIQAAFIGLIGGFFGLLGKECFYYIKNEYKQWRKK